MFARIANSWELVKASARVLRADKELLVFPLLSTIGTVLVSLGFLVPLLFSGLLDAFLAGRGAGQGFAFIVALLFYFAQYFVIVFANAALIGAALIRLRGDDPTVGDGLRIAFSHLGSILGYALIAATVGIVLRLVAQRSKALGRIVTSIIGLAWNLATFLVVPVLIVEDVGPIEAIRRSAKLLKRTWGEQLVGNLSIDLIFGLGAVLLIIFITAPFIFLAVNFETPAVLYPMIPLLVLVVLATSLISSTLSGIYAAAVYRYAAQGDPGGMFTEELVQSAFLSK